VKEELAVICVFLFIVVMMFVVEPTIEVKPAEYTPSPNVEAWIKKGVELHNTPHGWCFVRFE
jgi:16S rRNA A1518/A1519 N6-dimethyltransferase RsmA/KsgA/DIM1 with predicted DNA glycosylase/AP lyase activity